MIIKTLSKIKIHSFFYIVAFITLITGFFKEFSYIMMIISVHEIGHILTSCYFKWQIDRIIILPFGGLTLFSEKINRPLKEELLIALSGPLMQILCFSHSSNELILKYHYFLLTFNLLPIFPLDGSKILNILFNYFLPFKKSHKFSLIISLILVLTVFFYKFNLVIILVFSFLIFKITQEYRMHDSVFNKFLMERYIYDFHFNKRKTINGNKASSMFRDCKHLFCIDNKYVSEYEILKKRFDI